MSSSTERVYAAWRPAGRHANRMQSHFSAGEPLKRRQPDPGALKAEGPDAALGRVFILAGAKKIMLSLEQN